MTISEVADQPTFLGAHILIVDDEQTTRRTLAGLLQRLGYRTAEAASGRRALDYIARRHFDLVILDLKMPGMDGTEVLRSARPVADDTVFIILTAHGTLDSAITGIRHGAFDYLLKPSPVKEIVRAVEAGLAERQRRLQSKDPVTLLERALANIKAMTAQPETSSTANRFFHALDLTVDTMKGLVLAGGQPVDVTPTEFDVLTYLMRNQDRVVSCRELVAHLRGYDLDERDARVFLRSHIHRLRQKLERDSSSPCIIHTVRGRGYIISSESTEGVSE